MINLETLKDHEMMPFINNKNGNNSHLYAIIFMELLLLAGISVYIIQTNQTHNEN